MSQEEPIKIYRTYNESHDSIFYKDRQGNRIAYLDIEDIWGHRQLTITEYGMELDFLAYNNHLANFDRKFELI